MELVIKNIYRYIKLGEVHNLGDFYEISQYWFDDDSGHVIITKNKLMFSFYSNIPFNLRSELNVKQTCKEYDYISPYQVYPKIQVSKTLKRNGLKSCLSMPFVRGNWHIRDSQQGINGKSRLVI